MRMVRQGDVLLREVLTLPAACRGIRAGRRVILYHGEAAGHAHEIVVAAPDCGVNYVPARLYGYGEPERPGGRFLFVAAACVLTHQEHGAIPIRPGFYEVIRQQEYSPEPARNFGYVSD